VSERYEPIVIGAGPAGEIAASRSTAGAAHAQPIVDRYRMIDEPTRARRLLVYGRSMRPRPTRAGAHWVAPED
jgi:hypothetical protein